MDSSKKWVDGLVKKPIVAKVRNYLQMPIGALVGITVALTVVLTAGIFLAGSVQATGQELAFAANEQLLASGTEIKAELDNKIAYARQQKAERIAQKRRAEEEARRAEAERQAAEEEQQARLVAMHRSQGTARAQAQPQKAAASGGTLKTATYYTPDPRENGGYGVTATGENLQDLVNRGENVVASNDYALGTQIKINGEWYRVADRMAHGGKVDFLVGTHAEARAGGRHQVVIEEVR